MSFLRSRSFAAILAASATSFVLAAGAGADGGHGGDDNDSSGPSGTTTQQDSSGRRGGEAREENDRRHDDDNDRRGHGHGHRGNHTILRSGLLGSQTTDPQIGPFGPGGAPWVVDESDVRLRRNGKLRLRVEGLVIPAPQGNNTAGGVTGIAASVLCGGTVVATSKIVPLEQDGDARLRDKLTGIPARCLAPAVLVRPQVGGQLRDAYIAVTGG